MAALEDQVIHGYFLLLRYFVELPDQVDWQAEGFVGHFWIGFHYEHVLRPLSDFLSFSGNYMFPEKLLFLLYLTRVLCQGQRAISACFRPFFEGPKSRFRVPEPASLLAFGNFDVLTFM